MTPIACLVIALQGGDKLAPVVFAANMVGPVMEGDTMVQWWDVERALPNGRPDTSVDNSWREARISFKLVFDSRLIKPEADGFVRFHLRPRVHLDSPQHWQSAVPSQELESRFRTVSYKTPGLQSQWTSRSISGPTDQVVGKGYRFMQFVGILETSTHEIRSLGRERVHRRMIERSECERTTIVHGASTYNPYTDKVLPLPGE